MGAGANQFLKVVAVAGQLRFRAVALGDVARDGEDPLHAARLVAMDHGVEKYVDGPP